MALNGSGPISLAGSTTGQSIALELGLGATSQISLNDSAVRTLAGVPSGAITMPTNFWGKANTFTIEWLVVAGGGGGANLYFGSRGGPGAGGITLVTNYDSGTLPSKTVSVTVGGGGGLDSNGGNSSVVSSGTTIAIAYGGGNGYIPTVGGCGSGGTYRYGGSGNHAPTGASGQAGSGTGGTVTTYSTSGGNAWGLGGANLLWGGGGGGAGANGVSANSGPAAGGTGVYLANWAAFGKDTSNPGYFAGGGAGGVYQSTSGRLDGSDTRAPGGGGAAAGMSLSKFGTTNSGGGGGAGNGGENSRQVGGTGGSGIVVIRYPGATKASGGNISSSGGYTYHEFLSSGTIVFN